MEAHSDRVEQQVALVEEGEELENAEHTYQADTSQHDSETGAVYEVAEIHRKDREQIHDTVEAKCVCPFVWRTVQAGEVFEREECGEQIFERHHDLTADMLCQHTIEDSDQDADHDTDHQNDIKLLSDRRFAAEDYII